MIFFGSYFSPYSSQTIGPANSPPSFSHLFGTTSLGQDVFSQTVQGAYSSIPIGIVTAFGAVVLGLVLGIFAGYYDKLEAIFTSSADVVMVFPAFHLFRP